MLLALFVQFLSRLLAWLEQFYFRCTQLPQSSVTIGSLLDLPRSNSELVLENALLRQQLVILQRNVKKPQLTRTDRFSLLLLASRLPSWKHALLILKPDTLLHWLRLGFRLFWRLKSCAPRGRPPLRQDLVTLIQQMATENPSWGAERIRQPRQRAPQTRTACGQGHHPNLFAAWAIFALPFSKLEYLFEESCEGHLGV